MVELTVFPTEFVGMFMTYLRTKFYMSCYMDSLLITIKPKAKYRFHAAAMLLFYLLPKEKNKSCIFSKIYNQL